MVPPPSQIVLLTLPLKGLGREAERRELYLYPDLPKDKNLEMPSSEQTHSLASCPLGLLPVH